MGRDRLAEGAAGRPWSLHRSLLLLSTVPILFLLVAPILVLLFRAPTALLILSRGRDGITQAVELSLATTAVSTLLVVLFGSPLAQILARWDFRGKNLIEAVVDLPMVLPPAVAGLALLMVFGRHGLIGSWLSILYPPCL